VGKPRPGSIAVLLVSLPVFIGVLLYGPFVLDLFLHRRPPSRFLIPAGYVGWVRIEYRAPNATPLPREGKYLLVRLDRAGKAQTSSDLPGGWARDQFYYDSGSTRQRLSNAGWCKGGMIWGEESTPGDKPVLIQRFFVGNENQYRMVVDPAGAVYSPCG
jgi:hypothetical protein